MAPTLTDRQTPEADLYLLACLMLAQFILTLLGVAGLLISCLLGLFLSAMGLTRSAAKPDLVGFLLLLLYAGMCMFSSLAVYGNLTLSYGPSHLLFPLLYLLLSTMSGRESALLRRLCALWAAVVALWGLGEFLWRSGGWPLWQKAGRMQAGGNCSTGTAVSLVTGRWPGSGWRRLSIRLPRRESGKVRQRFSTGTPAASVPPGWNSLLPVLLPII